MADKSRVIPIMGKGAGNKELEDCPPSYHFELTPEQMFRAIQDPAAVARELGIDERVQAIHISIPEGYKPDPRATYCCIRCLSDSWCCTAWPM